MRLWGVAVLALVSSCYLGKDGKCQSGPFFEGPFLSGAIAASVGDRFLAGWRLSNGPDTAGYHGAMLASDGSLIADTRFDFEPDHENLRFTAGPDRVLVHGVAAQTESFVELRLPTGQRQGARLAGVSGYSAFDGDAFLLARSSGTALRLGLDGTVGPSFAIPPDVDNLAAMANATWAVFKTGEVLSASRIARGGGVIDAAPRMVADDFLRYVVGSRPTEAAIVTYDFDDVRTWHTLSADGSIGAPVPLVIDAPGFHPLLLVGERDGYLLVLDNLGSYEVIGVHISPTGVPGEPFALPGAPGTHVSSARSADRTLLVYSGVQEMPGGPPRIEAIPIEAGGGQGEAQLVETVEGETYTVDCGCSAGGGSSGVLVVLAFALGLRLRRRRELAPHRRI